MLCSLLIIFLHPAVSNVFQGPGFSGSRFFRFRVQFLEVAFQNIMTCLSHPLCHAVFIFGFKHIQQINLFSFFFLVTLNMYLLVGHKIKSTKHLKCTINNRAVSLKHVATYNMSKSTWFKQPVNH